MANTDMAFLLAPGAGAPSSHPRMENFRNMLEAIGPVASFDYSYALEGRKSPDRLPILIETHRAALAALREKQKHGGQIVLAGKSMGGRVGCHVALLDHVDAVICFGYPLCGAGDPQKLRDEVLQVLRTPILFIQGTKDRLCPLDLLEGVRGRMAAPNALYTVAGGDHSLLLSKTELKSQGLTQDEIDAGMTAKIAQFLATALG